MKTWVLKTSNGRYLCNGSQDGEYLLRYKYHLLKESNIVFDADKRVLQKIADEWNKDCCDDAQVKVVLIEFMFDEAKECGAPIKNFEKFKTPEERTKAIIEYCDRRGGYDYGCMECPLHSGAVDGVMCSMAWLDQEYEECEPTSEE